MGVEPACYLFARRLIKLAPIVLLWLLVCENDKASRDNIKRVAAQELVDRLLTLSYIRVLQ